MLDWIRNLPPDGRVLDLASGPGSFPPRTFPCMVVFLDEDTGAFKAAPALPEGRYYRAFGQAQALPFQDRVFDLIVCHHALEHVSGLSEALKEISRVIKPDGRLFVTVPNGHALCDAIYRFLFEGGGHVNRFRRGELVSLVETSTGLTLARWRRLYSSFAYLRRLIWLLDDPPPDLSPRLTRLPKGHRIYLDWTQRLLNTSTRVCDRAFGSHLAEYGWAFLFEPGGAGPAHEEPGYLNVCMICGSGHAARGLKPAAARTYTCPDCRQKNPYFRPFRHTE